MQRLVYELLARRESFDEFCERLSADLLEDVKAAEDMEQVLAFMRAAPGHREIDKQLAAKLITPDQARHTRDFLAMRVVATVALSLLTRKRGLHLVSGFMLTALRWHDENMAPWYGLAVRQLFMEELRKDKSIRRQMIELTSHLTVRQAQQVTGISRSTISRTRGETLNAVETPTVVERLTSLEARVAEVERQVGVLPPERVRDEVDAMLRSLDLGGDQIAAAA